MASIALPVEPFPTDFELHAFRRFAFFEIRHVGAFEAEAMQDARQMRRQTVAPAAENVRPLAE